MFSGILITNMNKEIDDLKNKLYGEDTLSSPKSWLTFKAN